MEYFSAFTTANPEAGFDGLYKLNMKMVNMALSWKFLQDVEEQNIGTNQVEMEEWKKEALREVKKGKEWPKKKGFYEKNMSRKKGNIKKQMKIKVSKAKKTGEKLEIITWPRRGLC